MAKLSKQELKNHAEAERLAGLSRRLTNAEQYFILEHFRPGAGAKTYGQMFFTPLDLAGELAVHRLEGRGTVVDIGAGIGALTRSCIDYGMLDPKKPKYVCIERSPRNVEIGRKVVPEAEWVEGDAFDPEIWERLGKVDYVISNPPFGNVASANDTDSYRAFQKELGKVPAHLKAVSLALRFSKLGGIFILPQGDLPFDYSGCDTYHRKSPSTALAKFMKTWPAATFNCRAVDCSVYKNEWKDASPKVELVYVCDGEE
jgi:hypothetical protein